MIVSTVTINKDVLTIIEEELDKFYKFLDDDVLCHGQGCGLSSEYKTLDDLFSKLKSDIKERLCEVGNEK